MLKRNDKGWESAKTHAKEQVKDRVRGNIPNYPYLYEETEGGANIGYDYQTESTEEAKIREIKEPKLRPVVDKLRRDS